ncbi:permease for cytosine/purines, uracil, thiamine, allantoin-domain-containing protein [Aspergillus pseudotamarii]|uniref:Permease for cytosine/purines, uracil, thiamine, allantoin-domain-containing protein n=1 Tax=Aspergillus pseudotamarii TaxID=132259 RepID=A0A5N6STT1_ASPPS|nr:permease for cytosine/purines, uracil, thiamine, allantoin-domain-containing protein [Aspergillus pseudotamarii]KAE8137160.1 permease for cytosine/purines, uracil, thiamine, allantoin-domain-containing protein [Aspergillus pseudotamarii]
MKNTILKHLEVPHDGGQIPSRWTNNDIKPIEADRRTWNFWTFHNFCMLIHSNISVYMIGSSLIAMGLTWRQSLAAIVAGNIIAVGLLVINSFPGMFYHIGFPLVNRYVWGLYGSLFVLWNRILLSIVWYAVQAWIGGECIYVSLCAIWPSLQSRIPNHMPESTGMTTAQFVAYIIFMGLSLPMLHIRPHKLQMFFYISSAIILVFEIVILIWALVSMDDRGFGNTISEPGAGGSGWTIAFGIMSTMGGAAAGILNQNDYTRFARTPREAILGQLVSFPCYSILCATVGILVTAATQNRYGQPLWSLPALLSTILDDGGSRSRVAAFFGGAALSVSQMGLNVPANAFAGGFDMAATFPKYINLRRGAYITALVSIACNPWKLVNTATTFLAVLSSYSIFLGPMVGSMIASYFTVMRRKIKVEDLFPCHEGTKGIYWYTYGVNWRAPVAWLCGMVPSLPGFVAHVDPGVVIPLGFTRIYYVCFLTGTAISAAVYTALHYIFPTPEVRTFVEKAPSPAVLMQEYRSRWDREDD